VARDTRDAALAGLTACSTKPISKAGSTDQHPQAIVLQMPDGSDPDGLYLAQDIAKLSHGALKVSIDSKTYNSQLPVNEARLTSAPAGWASPTSPPVTGRPSACPDFRR
jgi:hypothetical protein